jgi:hypothetical protein
MKLLAQFGICCLLVPGLFAAHPGGAAVGNGGGHRPGTVGTFGHGRSRSGYGGFGYGAYGYLGWGGLYGGFDEPFYNYGSNQPAPASGSNSLMVYPQPAPSAAVVETVHSVIHEYPEQQPAEHAAAAAEPDNQPVIYLIAFHDSTIRAATTYWVDGGTLHYLDAGHKQKQAPVSSVDRELSARLNRERHVPFNIP